MPPNYNFASLDAENLSQDDNTMTRLKFPEPMAGYILSQLFLHSFFNLPITYEQDGQLFVMKKTFAIKRTLFSVGLFFLLGLGCISIGPTKADKKVAKGLSFTPPKSPYVEFELESADRAWQNPKTGNTISYMSNCDGSSDQSLEALFDSSVEGIEGMKVADQRKIPFSQRESLDSTILGKVDGVGIQVRLIIFKKNSCTFNLSYIGSISSYMTGYNDFAGFIKEFKVP